MTRHRAMRRPSLANLVFLAGTASGALLTLSNFEGLASPASLQCLYAYNTPIRGCAVSDFGRDATCSESCIEGLQAVQFTVRSLCAKVNAASNPLLKQIQAGNILDVLCNAGTPRISTTSAPISHPATTLKTSTKQTSLPSQVSSSPQSTSSSASHFTSTSLPISTEAATSTAASTTLNSSITSVVVPSSTIESSNAATTTTTSQIISSEQVSSSSEESSKPTRPPSVQPGSGGGSPFDFVAASTAKKINLPASSITLAMVIALTTLTLI